MFSTNMIHDELFDFYVMCMELHGDPAQFSIHFCP